MAGTPKLDALDSRGLVLTVRPHHTDRAAVHCSMTRACKEPRDVVKLDAWGLVWITGISS